MLCLAQSQAHARLPAAPDRSAPSPVGAVGAAAGVRPSGFVMARSVTGRFLSAKRPTELVADPWHNHGIGDANAAVG